MSAKILRIFEGILFLVMNVVSQHHERSTRYCIASIFLICVLILSSCKITYKVRNQSDELEHVLYMPCGKATFELIGRGNSKFVLKQDFALDTKVRYMPEQLHISINRQVLLPEFSTKNVSRSWIEIDHDFVLNATFELKDGVFDGDIIRVAGNDFIDCNQQLISLDTLVFHFENNFRIRGINYPTAVYDQ